MARRVTKATAVMACESPAGHVTTSDDCDDQAPEVHPGQAVAVVALLLGLGLLQATAR